MIGGRITFGLAICADAPGVGIILVGLALGSLLGALNGFLFVRFRLKAFIVSLAALAIWRGVTCWISDRQLRLQTCRPPVGGNARAAHLSHTLASPGVLDLAQLIRCADPATGWQV